MGLEQVLHATESRVDPVPDPVLVVIGGLPGSGKTTLLRRLLAEGAPGVVGLDSEQVAERLSRTGIRLPYPFLRPWVHLLHRARVLRRIGGGDPVVVLTDPWTGPRWRRAVLAAAACAGRQVRLVRIDASAELAVSGQSARGRVLSDRAMRRHVRRAGTAPRDPGRPLVVDRDAAARLTVAGILGRPVPAP